MFQHIRLCREQDKAKAENFYSPLALVKLILQIEDLDTCKKGEEGESGISTKSDDSKTLTGNSAEQMQQVRTLHKQVN